MSPLRTLLTLAWPVVLARSAQAVIGFSDALMTAPLGEEAVAAVTTGAMNILSLMILPMGMVFIGQSFAAQLSSRDEHAAARRYARYGLVLAAASGVIAGLGTPLIGPGLSLLSYAPGVSAAMTSYLELRMLSVAAVVATEALGAWYGGLGNTRLHMLAGFAAMVVNVGLNHALIEGNLGAPALGVQGAALASVVASWAGLGVLAVPFWRGWATGQPGPYRFELRAAELWRMLRFGFPNGLSWFLELGAFTLFINVVVARLGTGPLAAMMIVFNVNSVSFMPAFGLSTAGAILAGQAIGAGNPDEVPRVAWLTIKVAACWQAAVGATYLLAPRQIMGAFAPPGVDAAALVGIGVQLLSIGAAWQLFDSVAIALGEILRAAGDTAWTMWMRIALAWLLFLPAASASVLWLGGGHVAAMLSVVVYIGAVAGLLVVRFRSGAWRRIDLTGADVPPLTEAVAS